MSAAHPGLPALRAGVAVAVPVLALTAHSSASGVRPGSAAILLCVALGAMLAAVVGGPSGRVSMSRTAAVLTVGQILGHLAASVGDPAAHALHVGPMLLWHAVAVPASAAALVLVARCYALVTAVVAVLTSSPSLVIAGGARRAEAARWPVAASLLVGAAPRAPPFSR